MLAPDGELERDRGRDPAGLRREIEPSSGLPAFDGVQRLSGLLGPAERQKRLGQERRGAELELGRPGGAVVPDADPDGVDAVLLARDRTCPTAENATPSLPIREQLLLAQRHALFRE